MFDVIRNLKEFKFALIPLKSAEKVSFDESLAGQDLFLLAACDNADNGWDMMNRIRKIADILNRLKVMA